jgi:hypothetical protein
MVKAATKNLTPKIIFAVLVGVVLVTTPTKAKLCGLVGQYQQR